MKKYLLGFFAVVLAVGFSAFTSPKQGDVTFYYIGSTVDLSEMELPSKWEVAASTPSFECETGTEVTCSFTASDEYEVSGKLDPLATIDVVSDKLATIEIDAQEIDFDPTEALKD